MTSLSRLNLTNGEGGMVVRLADFLEYMRAESAPVPDTREEMLTLLAGYVKHDRREGMRRISETRVARGESPLPARLLL